MIFIVRILNESKEITYSDISGSDKKSVSTVVRIINLSQKLSFILPLRGYENTKILKIEQLRSKNGIST